MDRINYDKIDLFDKEFECEIISHSSDSKPNKVLMIKSLINLITNDILSAFLVKSGDKVIYYGPILEIAVAYYNNADSLG